MYRHDRLNMLVLVHWVLNGGDMFDPRLFDLTGKRALVTGGGRGLGRAIASALGQMGAKICIAGRTDSSLVMARDSLAGNGISVETLVVDVSDTAASQQSISELDKNWPVDILVNNAGVERVTPSLDVDEAQWDCILNTNLKGSFFTAQVVARSMAAARRGGAIVNLCSLTSYVGVPTAVPYGSSKTGLLGMTRALAAEWADYGIRVNAIAPGYFRTDMTEEFYKDNAWTSDMLQRIPQRRFGELQDIGGAVAFLVSDAAGYITGQCIAVDGGMLASV